MIYLLALIGLVAVTVVMWRALGTDEPPARGGGVRGPDDDPDFLRGIDTGTARRRSADPGSHDATGLDEPEDDDPKGPTAAA
ncbi:hypothetical protein GCM10027047_29140 [Rhodococcus aerolatus]